MPKPKVVLYVGYRSYRGSFDPLLASRALLWGEAVALREAT
jgi:hypothetical protein